MILLLLIILAMIIKSDIVIALLWSQPFSQKGVYNQMNDGPTEFQGPGIVHAGSLSHRDSLCY